MKINQFLMKKILLTSIFLLSMVCSILAQVDQYDPACSTPDLDSATAVSLPWYNNNQFLENYLVRKRYNNLPQISFPTPNARTTTTTFLEPMFLVPLNIFIYRDGANDPTSSIAESEARDYVCLVNEIFRNAGTAIQFYTNIVQFEGNEFFNNRISSQLEVYDLWSRKRYIPIPAGGDGINVHFIRYNNAPENNSGKASLPYYPVLPYSNYSLYVRTHLVYSDGTRGGKRSPVDNAATLAHEIGHTLSLLHTHHPGRLPSLIFNETNATISNGCYQESVSRVKSNYWYNGCLSTDGLAKCGINGDFLCDTDADPRQSGLVSGCTFIPPLSGDYRTDNWGDIWIPPTRNVMSYSNSACLNQFSRHQTAIMWRQMEHFRTFVNFQAPIVSVATSSVCFGRNTTFTLAGTLPNDASVTWQVQPSDLVSIANGNGFIANLSAANSVARGPAEIIYTLIGPGNCYIARFKKNIQIGNVSSFPEFTLVTYDGMIVPTVCDLNQTFTTGSHTLTAFTNVPNVFPEFTLYSSGFVSGSRAGNNFNFSAKRDNINFTITYRATDNCASVQKCTFFSNNGVIMASRSIYPNPVESEVTIQLGKEGEKKSVALFNSRQEQVFFTESIAKEIVLQTGLLPEGYYIVKISDVEKVYTQRLQIKR